MKRSRYNTAMMCFLALLALPVLSAACSKADATAREEAEPGHEHETDKEEGHDHGAREHGHDHEADKEEDRDHGAKEHGHDHEEGEQPDDEHAHEHGGSSSGDVVAFTLQAQAAVGLVLAKPALRPVGSLRPSRALVLEDPSASMVIAAPVSGRVSWTTPNGASMGGPWWLGQRLQSGSTIGRILRQAPEGHPALLLEEIELEQVRLASLESQMERLIKLEKSGLLTSGNETQARAALKAAESEVARAAKEVSRVGELEKRGILSNKDQTEAKAALQKARVERERAGEELERIQAWASGGYELLQQRTELQGSIEEIRARLKLLERRLELLKGGDYSSTELVAPATGVVVEILAAQGTLVEAGEPLLTLRTSQTALLQLSVPRFDSHVLKSFRTATILRGSSLGPADLQTLAATTISEDIMYDESTGMNMLLMRIETGGKVYPGDYIDLQLEYGEPRELLMVPESAIIEVATVPYIFVLNGPNEFSRRRVNLGERIDGLVAVENGVSVEDTVVAHGSYDLYAASLKTALNSHQH